MQRRRAFGHGRAGRASQLRGGDPAVAAGRDEPHPVPAGERAGGDQQGRPAHRRGRQWRGARGDVDARRPPGQRHRRGAHPGGGPDPGPRELPGGPQGRREHGGEGALEPPAAGLQQSPPDLGAAGGGQRLRPGGDRRRRGHRAGSPVGQADRSRGPHFGGDTVKLQTWGVSDVGRARKTNEDSFLLAPEQGLFAVADGMGGYKRGDVASELACSVLQEWVASHGDLLARFREAPDEVGRDAVLDMLDAGVQQACRQIHDASLSLVGEGGRMGTTLDAVLLVGEVAFVVHVGDGRVYLARGGELHPLTEDHTLINQQLREGLIDEEQARRARNRNLITRALGVFPEVQVDAMAFDVDPADAFVLCTDGLHRYLGRRELGFLLDEQGEAPDLKQLVALANERGGRDNITVVVARLQASSSDGDAHRVAERMAVLRRVDLFQACTYRQLLAFTEATRVRRAPAGSVLFEEGSAGDEAFFIVAGRVAIEKRGTRLARLGPGHYFGELSLIDQVPRSASARVLQDATFLTLDRASFLRLIKQDGALGTRLLWQLVRKVSAHLRATNERLVAETVSLEELAADDLVSFD
ncbi:MAG: hypothetical protein D6798_01960 [Deltaproteobacteria bacterium]|nr:MAG: hypothetical protein D6798_01960 [Deltaproteobacteria bacterium]